MPRSIPPIDTRSTPPIDTSDRYLRSIPPINTSDRYLQTIPPIDTSELQGSLPSIQYCRGLKVYIYIYIYIPYSTPRGLEGAMPYSTWFVFHSAKQNKNRTEETQNTQHNRRKQIHEQEHKQSNKTQTTHTKQTTQTNTIHAYSSWYPRGLEASALLHTPGP